MRWLLLEATLLLKGVVGTCAAYDDVVEQQNVE